ncbi:hypothetical protein V8J88_14270 [Massilia sp. W12]|uniref:hypothetical protein n=1 Tax=Massilia sp. W12 TaxID=3126507 RepID=UPI0030CF66CD
MSPTSQHSLSVLRDGSQMGWHMIPLLLLVIYAYAREADQGNWSRVLAALAFWAMDWLNEIMNGLVFHFTQFAPIWGIGHPSSYLIFMGLNLEIAFNFALMGLVATMLLPKDPGMKILGVNNRLLFAVVNAALCVMVELALHHWGMLVWEWPWWGAAFPLPILLFGYLPFFLVGYWVYDMPCRKRQVKVVAALYSLVFCLAAGGIGLGWI